MITLDDFKKIELVVAKILEVEPIPGKDKLYRIHISLGNEDRYIISGIREYYKAEELIGKKIILIKNLEPKKIAGYESKGMLLAAFNGQTLSLITVDRDIPEGTEVS